MLVTFLHSRNTSLWPSVHSLPCPYEPAQPSQDVSDLGLLNGPDPEPHLQGDVLGWPQPVSSPMEMPDAWGCFWLSPCVPWALASGDGLVAACEVSVPPAPSRRPHSPQGEPSPCCTLTASFLPQKKKSSLHGKYKRGHNSFLPSRSHSLISHCYEAPLHWKNGDATDVKMTIFFQPQNKMGKHWK